MKKLLFLAGVTLGLVAINARIDATKRCGCRPECWCKKPGLRHFRWLVPYGHKEFPSEWKQGIGWSLSTKWAGRMKRARRDSNPRPSD